MLAYKVLRAGEWADLQAGRFVGAPVDVADGFVHLSTAAQVTGTVKKHFAGQANLILVVVNLEMLADVLKWEVARGREIFPHLYGVLTMAVVVAAEALEWDGDEVRLPV